MPQPYPVTCQDAGFEQHLIYHAPVSAEITWLLFLDCFNPDFGFAVTLPIVVNNEEKKDAN